MKALAETRSDEGYILKEDFFKFFNLPGLLGGEFGMSVLIAQNDYLRCLTRIETIRYTGRVSKKG